MSPFALYFSARVCSELAGQIGVVAIGWQIYARTHSAFALGLVGLVGFVPNAALVFVAGHVADRFDRRRVAQSCQAAMGIVAAALAWGSFAGWLSVPEIFAAVAALGITTAFESPAVAALLPATVPEGAVARATALSSGAWQAAAIAGPALGGFAFALAPGVPYALMAAFWLAAAIADGYVRLNRSVAPGEPASLSSVFAGLSYVRNNPAILGTISLDLFAVLLGGAGTLLPIFAHDILHTGPVGLGILRAAPALGAVLVTVWLAAHPIRRKAGLLMFGSVIAFGLATVVFALSRSLWLSLLALGLMGAVDSVSVVIRSTLVQVNTPEELRGRVSAVNFLFINASNQLGGFESGATAALLGAVPAAALGGIATVAVALLWMKLFPALRNVEQLE